MKRIGIKYQIIVASKDHVRTGVSEGIAQACHGKVAPLKRMKKGDFIVYYSSKQFFGKMDKCQEFTAIGRVKDDDVYQFQMTPDFYPSRRNIDFFKSKDAKSLDKVFCTMIYRFKDVPRKFKHVIEFKCKKFENKWG